MRVFWIFLVLFIATSFGHLSLADDSAKPAQTKESTAEVSKKTDAEWDDEYFFLVLEGKGMPVKHVLLNGVNVLGGSVVSLAMPINVTRQIRKGLNELEVSYVSHDTEELVTIMEKRTSGPKRIEVVKLALSPKESNGKEKKKTIAFNVDPAPVPPAKIELTSSDEKQIYNIVEDYYSALKTKNASKLRALYGPALRYEKKIFPEAARFFTKVLDKEVALLRREEIKMGAFDVRDLMLEQEEDKIRAVRKDRRPMMESNEIEVDVEPLISEVDEKGKKKAGEAGQTSAKQRLVTTSLLFRKLDGDWRLSLPRGI